MTQQQQEQLYAVPASLANALLVYLVTKPMNEVEGLVAALRQARPVEIAPPAPKGIGYPMPPDYPASTFEPTGYEERPEVAN